MINVTRFLALTHEDRDFSKAYNLVISLLKSGVCLMHRLQSLKLKISINKRNHGRAGQQKKRSRMLRFIILLVCSVEMHSIVPTALMEKSLVIVHFELAFKLRNSIHSNANHNKHRSTTKCLQQGIPRKPKHNRRNNSNSSHKQCTR